MFDPPTTENAVTTPNASHLELQQTSDFVEKPRLRATVRCSAAVVSEAKPGGSASGGEDWPLEGYKLRQFPKILGCGGQ